MLNLKFYVYVLGINIRISELYSSHLQNKERFFMILQTFK